MMNLRLTRRIMLAFFGLGVWCVAVPAQAAPPQQASPDLALSYDGELAPGALGLPGEQASWTLVITNNGNEAVPAVTMTGTLPAELRIERADAAQGSFAINGQAVTFEVGSLGPGASVTAQIVTTVMSSPTTGLLASTATLESAGTTRTAQAEIEVPTTLPATGYPPDEPLETNAWPVVFVGIAAFLTTATVLLAVFWRYAPH
ncbi:MAG: DUF11 domain-containing protein [Chloroflexi bacterium]|nr:DUF11 domain-containing protein [Chloroflexota bacterium]